MSDEQLHGPLVWMSPQADAVRRYLNEGVKVASSETLIAGVRQLVRIAEKQEQQLAEARAALREMCIAWENNPVDTSSDKRLRLIPVFEGAYAKWKRAAEAGGVE
jgi:hypothetical protein